MGPHAGVAGFEWLKDDLSLFPNNNISPLALPRHQNPRTISLGFQIIICPLDPSPSALSRTIAQFANRYLPLEWPTHTFQWVILLMLVMAMAMLNLDYFDLFQTHNRLVISGSTLWGLGSLFFAGEVIFQPQRCSSGGYPANCFRWESFVISVFVVDKVGKVYNLYYKVDKV